MDTHSIPQDTSIVTALSKEVGTVDFSGLKIRVASPADILSWSKGEVTKAETINYRTFKPEKDGLFDEKIFGPSKDYECYCGKYKRIRYKGIICDRCGVEVTQAVVRRERMGHITLSTPVAHIWFFKGASSPMATLLEMPQQSLERVVYYAAYLITEIDIKGQKTVVQTLEKLTKEEIDSLQKQFDIKIADSLKAYESIQAKTTKSIQAKEAREMALGELEFKHKESVKRITDAFQDRKSQTMQMFDKVIAVVKSLHVNSILDEEDYLFLKERDLHTFIETGMGAEVLFALLKSLDLSKLQQETIARINETRGETKSKNLKKLRIVDSFLKSNMRPEWLMLQILPVLPPDLRPVVQLPGGKFATSDLNDLYRRVINRNNRLKQLIELGAPEIILRNEKRMLQESVDSLIDMQKSKAKARTSNAAASKNALKSLSDVLRGKQGRFRQNLLGKRVDYSARSTITVGPTLKLDEVGIPKDMALEVFKPHILHEVMLQGLAPNVKSARAFVDEKPDVVYDILEKIVATHPVLLNRAPTLHKLSILGFYPKLVDDIAIRLHPSVCAGFNADFDGDAMSVFVPLSKESIDEVKTRMFAKHNLLKPSDGSPVAIPNKEVALGTYFLTSFDEALIDLPDTRLKAYENDYAAITAYNTHQIGLRQPILVRIKGSTIRSTVGRVLFNQKLPVELQYINEDIKASDIKTLIAKAMRMFPDPDTVAHVIDSIKSIGFWSITIAGGLSLSVFDCKFAPEKTALITDAEKSVTEVEKNFQDGLLTTEEKKRYTNKVWLESTEKIADATWAAISEDNPVKMIIKSGGARASREQLKQLSGMKGLVVDPMGKIIEVPTKTNYREGLTVFDYIIAARGGRKGLADSALKTADAGYLTRRLHDVAHDVIIRENDCGTTNHAVIDKKTIRPEQFKKIITGRYLAKDISHDSLKITHGTVITDALATEIDASSISQISIHTPIHCASKYGVCQKCYGVDLATGDIAELGLPVGVMAAQSIGEPGTQLTMRVKHFGGIVISDVTQGLPRVEELFEARAPKVISPIAGITGRINVVENTDKDVYQITITSEDSQKVEEYNVPTSQKLRVQDGDKVREGAILAEGYLDVQDVLSIKGLAAAQQYLVDEVQKVYESQGIMIHDKHFEIIVRKMSDKITIEDEGDTSFVSGEIVSKLRFDTENRKTLALGATPATGKISIMGITRAAIFTESWLSAASFEQTTNVLARAAIEGQTDRLMGLKENVIIGRLIPVNESLISQYDQKLLQTYANN